MPCFYARHLNYLKHFLGDYAELQVAAPIVIASADLALAAQTLGQRILVNLPINFQNLFDTFNTATGAFIWSPSDSYSVTRTLETLDGTRNSGECKILAAALLGLWVFPHPFGLGQARSTPKASLYRFENYDNDMGFISHHPILGVRGVLPNIMHPFGNPVDLDTRQPLYQWGDHKCVFYNGRLWDPSYQRIWDQEAQMVAFEFTGHVHPNRYVYQVRVVTSNAAKGWKANDLMYMQLDTTAGGWKGPYRYID